MEARGILSIVLASLAIAAGCVTVNIYFPAAAVERAADAIVSEIRPDGARPSEAEGEAGAAAPAPSSAHSRSLHAHLAALICAAPGRAEAEGIDLEIDTPLLRKIRASLKARYPSLLPYYEKGIVGETADGQAAIRTLEGLERQEIGKVRTLVADEVRDRGAMYAEIARANGIDASRVPDIARIFGTTFIGKLRPGFWYRDAKGVWRLREREKPPQI